MSKLIYNSSKKLLLFKFLNRILTLVFLFVLPFIFIAIISLLVNFKVAVFATIILLLLILNFRFKIFLTNKSDSKIIKNAKWIDGLFIFRNKQTIKE